MASHNDFGNESEKLAAEYLEQKGYHILERNYRFHSAEIDIIAEKNSSVVIVEVKARSTDAFMLPQEAVNKRKIKLIIKATNYFLSTTNIQKEVRFDIISILKKGDNNLEIQHIKDAFQSLDSL